MAIIQVDQSGKADKVSEDTLLVAVRDGVVSLVILVKREKREMLSEVRDPRQRKKLRFLLFAKLIFLVVEPLYKEGDTILIDNEYPGNERKIEGMIHKRFILNAKQVINVQITGYENVRAADKLSKAVRRAWRSRSIPEVDHICVATNRVLTRIK